MAVRAITPQELPPALEDVAIFYKEHYPDSPPFDADFFQAVWAELIGTGMGWIFVDEVDDVKRGTFGCAMTTNEFNRRLVIQGRFTLVHPDFRGQHVVIPLFEGVVSHLRQYAPFTFLVGSINSKTEFMWARLGFTRDPLLHFSQEVMPWGSD